MRSISRRHFLSFLGYGGVALGASSMVKCKPSSVRATEKLQGLVPGISQDDVILADGFEQRILISYGDAINAYDTFGFNNDFIAFMPQGQSQGIMWVNHEYPNPLLIHGNPGPIKTKDQVDQEMDAVGGSILHLSKIDGQWVVEPMHKDNYRVNAHSKIPLNAARPIAGAQTAIGTHSNCAGGMTSWGTFLTCEENYQDMVGDYLSYENPEVVEHSKYSLGWRRHYEYPPSHYGWVVEIDVPKKTAQKLTSLGRFSHESATCMQARDGRTVVYMGDDKKSECIYKFISEKPNSLATGTLYVANTEEGRWVALDYKQSPELQKQFKDQTDVLIWTRLAAKMLGGTPQHRPEDIAINPQNNDVIVALTNDRGNNDPFGSLLRIREEGGDCLSLSFEAETFQAGGEETGFACPDNLAFDPNGNLWMTTDISSSKLTKKEYRFYGNNGLFVIPMQGANAGKAIQVASAPHEAEFTGPCFAPDGKTLFLSVQHPGEESRSLDKLHSHWPDGGDALPKPSVIAITGSVLEKIAS